jgi:hypothetical protein
VNEIRVRTARLCVVALLATAMMKLTPMRAATTASVLGEQRKWFLEFRTRIEQPGQSRPLEVALTGNWTVTVVAARTGEYDVALELTGAHLSGNAGGSVPRETIEQAQQKLARRFWATYQNDGALRAVHFFKNVEPSDRNLLQMIATEAQFVRPAASKLTWNAMERDGAGDYLAIYNWAEPDAVIKRKLKYVHADAEPGAPTGGLHLSIEQSELRFLLDTQGDIKALEGEERVRVGGLGGDGGQLVAVTQTRLSNLQRGEASELIGSLVRAASDVVSSPILTYRSDPEKLRAQLDDQLLEGHTTESLLEAAMAQKNNDQLLSERLAAMFRRRPETIRVALAMLRRRGPQQRITYALGAAPSSGGIEALARLARDQGIPTPLRIDALSALVLVQHPSLKAMRIPFALLDDPDAQVASAARIMAGTVAHAGRKDHRLQADALDAALIVRYRNARQIADVCNLIAALGNSVGASVLPVIETALKDPRAPVRAAAARSLRLAGGREVDALLSATLTQDQDPEVREAAIFAVSFRRPTVRLGEALMRAAKEDPADDVRGTAVAELRRNSSAFPGVADTMAWVAEHDAKPGIRRLAHDSLAHTGQ